MITRKPTKQINIRNVAIGNGSKIAIQSMTNMPVQNVDATLQQISSLIDVGCDIVRIAVPNAQASQAFAQVRKQVDIPLVADIHFDYRLAIAAIEAGADKIRINPGNIALPHLDAVIDCAKANNTADRSTVSL